VNAEHVLAIIPARGGSKGITRKNLRDCAGRPLVDWTIAAANDSRRITTAILTSEETDILARGWGKVRRHRRPLDLAHDDTPTEPVIADALDWWLGEGHEEPGAIVLLQPTSPQRTGRDIDDAIALLERTDADSVVSVVPSHAFLWTPEGPLYHERRRRQELEGRLFEENGSIYVFTLDHWRRTGNRLGGHVELYVMGEEHRTQVDTPFDLEQVSWQLARERSRLAATA